MHKKFLKIDLAHHEEKIPRASFHADFYFSLYMLVVDRKDIKELFGKLGSPGALSKTVSVLTRKQFQFFLADRQHDCRLNEQLHPPPNDFKISALITRFSTAKSKGLRFCEFARFLLSDECVDLDRKRFTRDDDSLHDPLPHYFINSSHNTYTTRAQISTVKYFMSARTDDVRC